MPYTAAPIVRNFGAGHNNFGGAQYNDMATRLPTATYANGLDVVQSRPVYGDYYSNFGMMKMGSYGGGENNYGGAEFNNMGHMS